MPAIAVYLAATISAKASSIPGSQSISTGILSCGDEGFIAAILQHSFDTIRAMVTTGDARINHVFA